MLTLTGNELVVVYPLPADANYEATPDGYPVLTPEIVTLSELVVAGGGGYASQKFVNSGTTDTVNTVNIFIGWLSSASGEKTQTIPTSSGSLGIITINDMAGTASLAEPIVPVPESGSILGDPEVYSPYSSITLLDTSEGWVQI